MVTVQRLLVRGTCRISPAPPGTRQTPCCFRRTDMRTLSLAAVAFTTAGLFLGAPSAVQAQGSYSSGSYYGGVYPPSYDSGGYAPGYGTYYGYSPGYSNGYGYTPNYGYSGY